MNCTCKCSSCARSEAHYSSYHCKHWISEYGDLEYLGVCPLDLWLAREARGPMLHSERETFQRAWLASQRGY